MPVREPSVEFQVRIVIEPDGETFHAYCQALKGLHTCGDTEEQVVNNVKDAALAYLRSLIKHGDPIPVGILPDNEASSVSSANGTGVTRYTRDLVVAGA